MTMRRIVHDTDEARRRLARIAWLLDSSIRVPGTRFSFGLDAVFGLIPGLGDALGVLLSSYIVREAARLGASRSVLMRMVLNVAIEGVVGLVPFLGDFFDAAWKANQRNVALLEAHLDDPRRTAKSSRTFLTLVLVGLFLFLAAVAFAGFLILHALWRVVSG